MDNRYNRHNRRKYSLKVHIILVTKYRKKLLNSIGRKGYFGQTDTLLAVLEKYRQRLYKNILKVRVNS